MKPILVLTAAAVAAATLTATAQAHLPGATFCSARQPAKVELRCATRDRWHALTTLRWLEHHRAAGSVLREARRRLVDSRVVYAATPLRRRIVRDHRWLYRESVRRIREARARLVPPRPRVDGCLSALIGRESGWNVHATNPVTGAYGLPQALPGSKMASAGPDWRDNPATQIKWMWGYIRRYGGSCGALAFQMAHGWY